MTSTPAEIVAAVAAGVSCLALNPPDPEAEATSEAQGTPFILPCLFVTRVRDGHIIESRDYAHHIAQARAFGHLPALAAALTD